MRRLTRVCGAIGGRLLGLAYLSRYSARSGLENIAERTCGGRDRIAHAHDGSWRGLDVKPIGSYEAKAEEACPVDG